MNALYRSWILAGLAFAVAASPALAARKKKAPRRAPPEKATAAAPKAEEAPPAEAPAEPAPAEAAEAAALRPSFAQPRLSPLSGRDRLAGFGLDLSASDKEVSIVQVLPGSQASALGLSAGDRLLYLGGAEVSSVDAAAQALAARRPETRLSAVVRRGLSVMTLENDLPAVRLPAQRKPGELSPLELEHRAKRIEEARQAGPKIVEALPTPRLDVPARQRLWVRFPKGVTATAKAGDILEGVTAAAVAADAQLDYLAIPPGSPVWAEVTAAGEKDGVWNLKLRFFKLRAKGGHGYALAARLVDLAGDHQLTRVSPGGTLVTAELPSDKLLLAPEARLQIETLERLSLYEAPAYFLAGVGLWFRVVDEGKDRAYEVTHVIPHRSAENAGIKVGDRLTQIDGTSASRLDLAEAQERLYGRPLSAMSVRVLRGGSPLPSMTLVRGVSYRPGLGFELDSNAASGEGLLVANVMPESPAYKSGLRPGDRILLIGSTKTEEISATRLRKILQGDLKDESSITIRRPDNSEKVVTIEPSPVRSQLPPPYKG